MEGPGRFLQKDGRHVPRFPFGPCGSQLTKGDGMLLPVGQKFLSLLHKIFQKKDRNIPQEGLAFFWRLY